MNEEEQQIEIAAIQAIYEDDFVENEEKPSEFQLIITPNLANFPNQSIQLNVLMDDQHESTSKVTKDRQISVGKFKIHHLPPLTMSLKLPDSYPSHEPPLISLSSMWLTRKDLKTLVNHMKTTFTPGCPVIYDWCEFLQSQAIEFLLEENREDYLSLWKSTEEEQGQDPEAISQCISIQDTVVSLLNYNRKLRDHYFYLEDSIECRLCLEEKPGTKFQLLGCCDDSGYCLDCLQDMCTQLITLGNVGELKCPNCSQEFSQNILKMLCSSELFERWDYLTLQRGLDAMSDVSYCPRCETVVIADENLGQCMKCAFSFCIYCKDSYHQNSKCDEFAAYIKNIKDKKNLDLELKSLRAIKKCSKPCPECRVCIQKTEGCNKMTCNMCNSYFCYLCGKKIQGYDHFQGGQCKLFDVTPEYMRFFEEEMQRVPNFVVGIDFNPARLRDCPYCGQRSMKDARNNDINCWSCRRHFCFLCGVGIKGTTHFLNSKCKQHTD
jgi:E3 ubiquitin-protein ligase RNF14